MKEQIIKYIESNKISTTQVAQALGEKGTIEGVKLISKPGKHVVGELYYVTACGETDYHMHQQIKDAKENSIVLIEHWLPNEKSITGDLVHEYLLNYKKTKGIVVKGNVKDVQEIIKKNHFVWAKGTNPTGLKHNYIPITRNLEMAIYKNKEEIHGGILVADDNGAVIINLKNCNDKILSELERINNQEKKWHNCLTNGMNTFEIICQMS